MLRVTRNLRILAITALMATVLMACGATTSGNATSSAPASSPATVTTATTVPTTVAQSDTTAATTAPSAASAAGSTATAQPDAASVMAATAKLNLNEVTSDQLLSTIPRFNARMVREFMEYRPYISIQQFRQEIGKYVSAEQVSIYEQYVYVPVDVDQADAATLQQLPGVDAIIADQLIAGRPYGSSEAFLAKLAGSVSDVQVKQAAAYLTAK